MHKNIAVNTLFLIPGKVGGTEVFLRNHMDQLTHDRDNRYFIFTNRENHECFRNLPPNFRTVKAPIRCANRLLRILWEQLVLPFQVLYYRIDLLHSPGYTGPLLAPCIKLTTLFDLNYHFHPHDFTTRQLLVYKTLIPLVARTSTHILVHSQATKDEIVAVLGVSPAKISVIHGSYHPRFLQRYAKDEIDRVVDKYGVRAPFLLSNAVSHPHKNLPALIKAYAMLRRTGKLGCPLVLLGFPGRDQSRVMDTIREEKVEKDVIFTGWVPQEDVPFFYQGAILFVFPSLYEGFGIPSVEAMASGVPLIASNASCIPEVVGDGGLLTDATRPEALATSIGSVLDDAQLAHALVARGEIRAREFSWERFGKEMRALYDSLLP